MALRVPCPTLTSILGPRSEAYTTAACLWPRPHLAARVRRPACLSALPRARAPAFPLGRPRRHPPADAKLRSLARARRQTFKARSPFFLALTPDSADSCPEWHVRQGVSARAFRAPGPPLSSEPLNFGPGSRFAGRHEIESGAGSRSRAAGGSPGCRSR